MNEENLRRVQYLCLVQLFASKEQVYIVSTLIGVFLSSYTSFITKSQGPYIWVSSFILYLLARYSVRKWFQTYASESKTKRRPKKYERAHMATSLFGGLQWGLFAPLFVNPVTELELFFVVLTTLTGIAAGSIPTNAASKKSSICYICGLMIPTILICLKLEGHMQYLMLVLTTLFMSIMIRGAKKIHDSIYENIKLRIENEEIYEELRNSEQSKMDARLEAYENSKMASIGKMSAGLAHEINNPLTVINGHLRVMEKCSNDKSKVMTNGFFQCFENIERISTIIHSLRNVSKVDSSSEKTSFDIRNVIQEIIGLSREKMKMDKVTLIYDPPLIETIVHSSKDIMRDIIIKLLNHSIESITHNSESWIQINISSDSNYAMVEVIDSSYALEKDQVTRIFDPFFSASSILESTGVDLSKAKISAQSYGGDLKYNEKSFNKSFILYICLPQEELKKAS